MPALDQDEMAIQGFLQFLELFVEMEQAAPLLSGDDLVPKWKKDREYANRLIDEGGVSTDLFTEALGAENPPAMAAGGSFLHAVLFTSCFSAGSRTCTPAPPVQGRKGPSGSL